MDGLKTARVLVVDDNETDGNALIASFSKLGVGALYFRGVPEELPESKLRGLRLLALDMQLQEGLAGDDTATLSPLLTLLDRLLADDNGPFIIIGWTNHPGLLNEFKNRFIKLKPLLKPCFFVRIPKSEVRNDATPAKFDIDKIVRRLEAEMENWTPINLIMRWEQLAHDAASGTTASISGLVVENPSDESPASSNEEIWRKGMVEILGTLARASAGKTIDDDSSAVRALFYTLNPIHFDCLDCLSQQASDGSNHSVIGNVLRSVSPLQDVRKVGALNNMILLEKTPHADTVSRPGNVYILGELDGKWPFFEMAGIRFGALVHDLFDPTSVDKLNEHTKTTEESQTAQSTTGGLVEQLSRQRKELMDELKNFLKKKCKPILVEITPACDFAQRKHVNIRLVAGLLVPHTDICLIKTADFVRKLPVLKLDGEPEPQYLFLDAHFLVGICPRDFGIQPAFRLRKQLLVDIQAWFAAHAARPGYVSL